jgi:multiple sugar transport system substrate-binding protein
MNLTALPTRPFQIVVMAIFALLAVVGLVLFASFTNFGGSGAKVGTVTIWGILPVDAVTKELDTIRQTDKSYQAVKYVQRSADTFDADLANAIASGGGPDLVLISQEQLNAERSKLNVIPFSVFSQRSYLDTFVPISELYLTDSGTYGFPLVVDPLVLYFNRPLLSNVGVAQPPSTWEAVTGLAPRLTQKAGGQITQSAIAMGDYNNIPNARALISALLFQSGSPIVTLSTNGALRSALGTSLNAGSFGTSPAESAMSFYTQFADPAKTVYSWNRALPDARQNFIAGSVVLYPGFASERPLLSAANPNLDFDMTVIPQPSVSQSRSTYGKVYALAIPKASRNPSGALLVARLLAGKVYALDLAHTLSMAPAQRTSLAPASNDRFQAVYYPEALVSKGWLSPLPTVTDGIFSAMIGNITSGTLSVRDALDKANQALDAAL